MHFSHILAGRAYPTATIEDQITVKVRYRVTNEDGKTIKYGVAVIVDDTPESIERVKDEALQDWPRLGTLEYCVVPRVTTVPVAKGDAYADTPRPEWTILATQEQYEEALAKFEASKPTPKEPDMVLVSDGAFGLKAGEDELVILTFPDGTRSAFNHKGDFVMRLDNDDT